MKREVRDLDFYQCPTTEIDGSNDPRVHREPVMPIIPQKGDGFNERAEPISQGEKMKKALKIAAIIAIAALFVGFSVVFVMNNPELFKIGEIKPFGKW